MVFPGWWRLQGDSVQHVFVDGSCLETTSPCRALSGWAVILANRSAPICTGTLPGIAQSINRAELFSLLVAVQWAVSFCVSLEVWSDSQYVCDGYNDMIFAGGPNLDGPNADLWQLLWSWVSRLLSIPKIHKVKAHRAMAAASSQQEQWEIYHNDLADRNAKLAVHYPAEHGIAETWKELQKHHQKSALQASRFQLFLLNLAKMHLTGSALAEAVNEGLAPILDVHGVANDGDFVECFPLDTDMALGRSSVVSAMGLTAGNDMVQFLRRLDAEAEFQMEVTTLELCVAFLHFGFDLPFQVNFGRGPQWLSPSNCPAGSLMGGTLALKLATFTKLMRAVLKAFRLEVDWTTSSRVSSGLYKSFPALLLPWPLGVARVVHSVLADFTVNRPIRCAADLARSLHL